MSRLDDLKKQNPQLDVSLIDIIASLDPTSTYKYLGFMLKIMKSEIGNEDVRKIIGQAILDEEHIDCIKRFEAHCLSNRIKNPDISSYKSLDDLEFAVKQADTILKQKESEKQVIKIYDTDEYLVLLPLTFDASKTYGANTKWCVTMDTHWKSYQWAYKLIYIINKKNGTKYAVSRKYDDQTKIQAWLSDDREISPLLLPLPNDVTIAVFSELQKGKYESELNILNENSIITDEGVIVPFDRVDRTMLSTFMKRFGVYLSTSFKEKIIKRSDELGLPLTSIDISSKLGDERVERIRQLISSEPHETTIREIRPSNL